MNELKIGLIGGTGLGEAILARTQGRHHEINTPFGRPSDAIIETEWQGVTVYVLSRHGQGHLLPPAAVPYQANIFALKTLGVTHILASGAVGSLREELQPKDLVIPDQIIDKTHRRAGTFYDQAAVHVAFSEPFCPVLRRMLIETAAKQSDANRPESEASPPRRQDIQPPPAEQSPLGQPVASESSPEPQTLNVPCDYKVHDRGCYVCMEGPAFSTRAESLMHRLWGGDLIGMTAIPEARLAIEAEIPYALIALVTDYDSWRLPADAAKGDAATDESARSDPSALLREIIGNLTTASDSAIDLMRRTVRHMAEHRDELAHCPATESLKLAIWSDKSRIDPAEVQRLAPLWSKYFDSAPTPAEGNQVTPDAHP